MDRKVREIAIVLGARGRAALRRRAEHGARLVLDGRAVELLAVGGGRPPEAEAIAAIAREAGVPAAAVRVEPRSRNTLENAVQAARLLAGSGCGRAWVVTDWPHLPRAWACLRLAGLDVRAAPVPGTARAPRDWLREAAACVLYVGHVPDLLRVRRQVRNS